MKHFYLLLLTIFFTLYTQAQNQPFITTWEVFPSDLSITIPTHPGSTYNYTVDFGDGTVLTNQTGDAGHTYNSAGTYTVTINGSFPRIYFNNNQMNGDRFRIKSIDQWGDISWQSMSNAFHGCHNLVINATDIPDLTQVTDLSYMFAGCSNLNQPLNNWDVSNITDIKYMFFGAVIFNQPLNNWDVSIITDMSGVFRTAFDFNQNINNWNISNVQKTYEMFRGAIDFDQPLNNWDVSNVYHITWMFSGAESFNQPLDNWDVTGIAYLNNMFYGAKAFNQNINNWDVSGINTMDYMFAGAENYNQPLNNWNVSNVNDMSYMFEGAMAFNQNINNWSINAAITEGMFKDATSFNQPLDNWFPSPLSYNIKHMFAGATSFNQPLNTWNLSNVYSIKNLFYGASSFNKPLNNWDVSGIANMEGTFEKASSFNQDLSNWNFITNVHFGWTSTGDLSFIKESGLDVDNYDKLLAQFVNLNLTGKSLNSLNLEYCNQFARNYLINTLNWQIDGDILATTCNKIVGTITYDENNNGCDQNDLAISGFSININDGTFDSKIFSDNGNYEFNVSGANYTVSLVNYPSYFSVAPINKQVTFTTTTAEVADFCVTANQSIEDLNVVLIPTGEARPGFEADYQLVIENIGTQTLANATVTLDFDDTMQSFVSASVTPTSTTVNQLTFDITNLQPLTFQTVDITMQTFQPPTVNGDDILSFTANVSPSANDFTPNDNTFIYDQTVVNSYDPNDKQVLQGEEIEIDEADEYLNYLIRFQNTGTASAINVRILDTLHPKLDYSTLRPVNASHNYRIEVTNENEVEFIFDGINLPDENTNEPASHGFVAYKIKPKNDVAVGDFITGDANIYFDFNAPIITNMVSTEIINDLSSTSYELENNISIYPNPTQNILHIETKNNQKIEQLKIYNLNGLELINVKENKQQLNLESLSAGVYFLQIQTNLGTVNKRFIKN